MIMRIYRLIFLTLSSVLLIYLLLPNPNYPQEITNIKTVRSTEPGDSESILRRGYYTDANRYEVLKFYSVEFNNILGIHIPTYKLNYPPEEAQTLIRDQTRSTFLEEIVHPMRESLFVNGFEPKEDKDAIIINKTNFRQKITVKYLPSRVFDRIVLAMLLLTTIWHFNLFLYKELLLLYRFFSHYGFKHNNY